MRRPAAAYACLHLVVLLSAASPVLAADERLPSPAGDGWKPLEFPKISQHTVYSVVQADDSTAFKAEADCSASAMYVPAAAIDLTATPVLRWRWKLERGIEVADERAKAGDDFAARVYVMFRFDPTQASWLQRATHALGRRLYGDIVPGNAVNYVWSSRAAVGSSWKSPYTDASQMIVKRTGAADGWIESEADIAADYRASFGHKPPPMLSVAVMSDTDNTCQTAVAYFADFRFTARTEP